MSKIIQFSTIGALMAGHLQGEKIYSKVGCGCNFGLGCSANLCGELTIYDGIAYEATAGKALETLDFDAKVPFIQITKFKPEQEHPIEHINHLNLEKCLARFIQHNNIFLAVSVQGVFDKIVIRRPRLLSEDKEHTVDEFAESQKVDTHQQISGRLIGFWTPELYGRIAVPGFHFHFLDASRKISGHMLEFNIHQAVLSFEEKQTLKVTNPSSQTYKEMKIDMSMLDEMINNVEK